MQDPESRKETRKKLVPPTKKRRGTNRKTEGVKTLRGEKKKTVNGRPGVRNTLTEEKQKKNFVGRMISTKGGPEKLSPAQRKKKTKEGKGGHKTACKQTKMQQRNKQKGVATGEGVLVGRRGREKGKKFTGGGP